MNPKVEIVDALSRAEYYSDRYIRAEELLLELYDLNPLALLLFGRGRIRKYLDARIKESESKFTRERIELPY